MKSFLTNHVNTLAGVGTNIAQNLAKLNIHTLFDLLLHLPRDYEDRSHIVPISMLKVDKFALIQGVVADIKQPTRGRTKLEVLVSDNTGMVTLRFFKTYASLLKQLQMGNEVRLFGEIKRYQHRFELIHPEIQIVNPHTPLPAKNLTAVYPTTKGITQNKLRSLVKLAIKTMQNHPESLNHDAIITDLLQLPAIINLTQIKASTQSKNTDIALNFINALNTLHQPSTNEQADLLLTQHPAKARLKIEELVANQISLLTRKARLKANKAPRCVQTSELANQLKASLPFKLTNAQQKVTQELIADITTSKPMVRLVQGDVGAGKTLVAAIAACHALDAGWQVALMAPTEILASQHFDSFTAWLAPLGINTVLLSGKLTAKQKKQCLEKIASNDVQLIIGTHALFQKKVDYAKLGLVIIDEQHRFGVQQRLAIRDKGVGIPHQLVMTATPIPRTLAMSVYGDMDTSIIDELPPNRTPVTTLTVANTRKYEVIERIEKNCLEGKQAYWICPLVEDSETSDTAAAQSTFAELEDHLSIKVGLVHGKMKADEKQTVMDAFKKGDISLLVATTVIEVGVDVPNASLMVIENAERLGLSQLHQLRGRVGRGTQKSYCVLMYKTPLSQTGTARLNILKSSSDGFLIAEEDLKIRGPGELIGKRQAGNIGFYVANLQEDQQLLPHAKKVAQNIIAQHPNIANELMEKWLYKTNEFSHV